MAVDFAHKRQERDGGWALRSIKLRMSRKLIFAAGLWMCLSCEVKPSSTLEDASPEDPDGFQDALADHLLPFISRSPLEILAGALRDFEAFSIARRLLGAYDLFLGILDAPERRGRLEHLAAEEAAEDEDFQHARRITSEFQDGLTSLFFKTDDALTEAAQTHGVF